MASSSSKYFSLYFTQNSVIVFTFIINSTTSWSFWILRPFLWNRICYFRGKKSSIQAVPVHTTLIIDDENPTRLWICNATFFPYSEQNQQNYFDLKKKKLHHQFHSRLTRSWLVNSWCFTFFHLLQLTSLFIKRAFCYINDLFPFHLGQLYYVKKSSVHSVIL